MTFSNTTFPILAAVIATTVIPASAPAQSRGTTTQQAENDRTATDLHARMTVTEKRITATRRSGRLTRARAAALQRQLAQAQASMTRLARRQGFVSAAEFASFERTLGAIDVELDRRGVARGFGDDALPSAEVAAFRRTDARLGYRDARIEHDARGCAVYRGVARDGRMQDEALMSLNGEPICIRRQ